MSPAREKGVMVIGEDSLKKANWNRNRLGLPARRPCKPFGEVHLKRGQSYMDAKDLFPRVLSSNDLVPSEDIVVSTEKLRLRLAQEGVGELVIKGCESIMLLEVSELQNQLKALQSKHVMLLDTLRQLETEKIELETTVVDETKERESYCSQGNRRHGGDQSMGGWSIYGDRSVLGSGSDGSDRSLMAEIEA
ncbi:putative oxysterol-binding protein [Rosa chinensis]|uniref:Putative oxysterol-binding protein n=1 Tax=Rosa chinensis TaxID=74649 RepID=A0A2P6PNQ7_ROSCH|nr:putative oxysterol-binding protein [Rosa chinensis]